MDTDTPPSSAASEDRNTRWYGWQTLAADGAAATLLLVGGLQDDSSLLAVGAGTYLLAAPLLHVVNERPGAALGSFGLRVALPLVTGLLAVGVGCGEASGDGFCAGVLVVAGGVAGMAGAVTLDAAALARAPVARGSARRAPGARWASEVTPRLTLSRHRGELGVSVTF